MPTNTTNNQELIAEMCLLIDQWKNFFDAYPQWNKRPFSSHFGKLLKTSGTITNNAQANSTTISNNLKVTKEYIFGYFKKFLLDFVRQIYYDTLNEFDKNYKSIESTIYDSCKDENKLIFQKYIRRVQSYFSKNRDIQSALKRIKRNAEKINKDTSNSINIDDLTKSIQNLEKSLPRYELIRGIKNEAVNYITLVGNIFKEHKVNHDDSRLKLFRDVLTKSSEYRNSSKSLDTILGSKRHHRRYRFADKIEFPDETDGFVRSFLCIPIAIDLPTEPLSKLEVTFESVSEDLRVMQEDIFQTESKNLEIEIGKQFEVDFSRKVSAVYIKEQEDKLESLKQSNQEEEEKLLEELKRAQELDIKEIDEDYAQLHAKVELDLYRNAKKEHDTLKSRLKNLMNSSNDDDRVLRELDTNLKRKLALLNGAEKATQRNFQTMTAIIERLIEHIVRETEVISAVGENEVSPAMSFKEVTELLSEEKGLAKILNQLKHGWKVVYDSH